MNVAAASFGHFVAPKSPAAAFKFYPFVFKEIRGTRSAASTSAANFQAALRRDPRIVRSGGWVSQSQVTEDGRLHQGFLLEMLEEAGMVAAANHILQHGAAKTSSVPTLVRMDRVEFLDANFVGEIIGIDSLVTFTSDRSMEVSVAVEASGLSLGELKKRLTTIARLWFVAVDFEGDSSSSIVAAPPLTLDEDQRAAGLRRYSAQKQSRAARRPARQSVPEVAIWLGDRDFGSGTVDASQFCLAQYVNVNDCDERRFLTAGALLKPSLEAATTVARLHARGARCVPVSLNDYDFRRRVESGAVLHLQAHATFADREDIEVEVVAHGWIIDLQSMALKKDAAFAVGFFSFVAVDADGKKVGVPALKVETQEEREVFEEGKRRKEMKWMEREEFEQVGGK